MSIGSASGFDHEAKAEAEGRQAFHDGTPVGDCPYVEYLVADAWSFGWWSAKADARAAFAGAFR